MKFFTNSVRLIKKKLLGKGYSLKIRGQGEEERHFIKEILKMAVEHLGVWNGLRMTREGKPKKI